MVALLKSSKAIKVLYICVIVLMITCIYKDREKLSDYIFSHLPDRVVSFLLCGKAGSAIPEKFWLHRVNSVEKQKEFAGKFNGIEFDVVFYPEQSAFENSHDKTGALHKYNLEKQFAVYGQYNKGKGIWLDVKNLTNDNKELMKKTLNELLDKYKINKEKIWIESPNWKALKVFKEDGWHTSYYFPYYDFNAMTEQEIQSVKHETLRAVFSGNVEAVSFSVFYYNFIKGLSLPDGIALLTWAEFKNYKSFLRLAECKTLLEDEQVKVILVADWGKHSR